MHPKKIFRRYEIASDIIFGPMFLRGQMTEFHTLNIYSFCPCIVQHWFWLSECSLISQATPFTDVTCWTIIVRL